MRQLIVICLSVLWLTGCAATTLKAPCNATGSNCGKRILINTPNSN